MTSGASDRQPDAASTRADGIAYAVTGAFVGLVGLCVVG